MREKITIDKEDYIELGKKGEISFPCMCGCGKSIMLRIYQDLEVK